MRICEKKKKTQRGKWEKKNERRGVVESVICVIVSQVFS